jgi:hypothetical protein
VFISYTGRENPILTNLKLKEIQIQKRIWIFFSDICIAKNHFMIILLAIIAAFGMGIVVGKNLKDK